MEHKTIYGDFGEPGLTALATIPAAHMNYSQKIDAMIAVIGAHENHVYGLKSAMFVRDPVNTSAHMSPPVRNRSGELIIVVFFVGPDRASVFPEVKLDELNRRFRQADWTEGRKYTLS